MSEPCDVIRVIRYHILNMLKIRFMTSILSNLHNLHSLEVEDSVSETQPQVSKNSN